MKTIRNKWGALAAAVALCLLVATGVSLGTVSVPVLVMAPGGSFAVKASLAAAASAADTANRTIWVLGYTPVSTNVTIPANRALKACFGANIEIASGKTLTISGPFEAGDHAVFSGSGSVAGLKVIRPQWAGSISVDGQTALNKAITWANASGGGVVDLNQQTATVTSIVVMKSNVTLRNGTISVGTSWTQPANELQGVVTNGAYVGMGYSGYWYSAPDTNIVLEDLTLLENGKQANGYTTRFANVDGLTIRRCTIYSSYGMGTDLYCAWKNVEISGCSYIARGGTTYGQAVGGLYGCVGIRNFTDLSHHDDANIAENLRVTNNSFWSDGSNETVGLYAMIWRVRNVTFTGNTITGTHTSQTNTFTVYAGNDEPAISSNDSLITNVTITGNSIKSKAKTQAVMLGSSDDAGDLRENKINFSSNSVYLEVPTASGSPTAVWSYGDATIANNVILASALNGSRTSYGIFSNGADAISDNRIENFTYGLYLAKATRTVERTVRLGHIQGCTESVFVGTNAGPITILGGNVIGGRGVHVLSSSDIILKDIRFKNCTRSVYLQGSSGTPIYRLLVEGIRSEGSTEYGFHMNYINDAVFRDNRVENVASGSVALLGTGTFSNVRFSNCNFSGFDTAQPKAFTANSTLYEWDSNGVYTNIGAVAAVKINLPIAKAGLGPYWFVRTDSQAFRVDPNGTQTIRGGGAGKYLELQTDGGAIGVQCLADGTWEIVSSKGTTAFEP